MQIEIQNNSSVTIHGLKPGAKRFVQVDRKGTPFDKHWRRRLRDSKIDGAISIIKIDVTIKTQDETED